MISNSILLLTAPTLLEEASDYIDKQSCTILLARRTLNHYNLEKLFPLAHQSKILVVNDSHVSTIEIIRLLNGTGFDQFIYTPYWPDCQLQSFDYDYIITPGQRHLCPEGLAPVIDIGPRILDFISIVEILQAIHLLDERSNLVAAKYVKQIISQGWQLSNVNEFLYKVINSVDDGLLSYDEHGNITLINSSANEILNLGMGESLSASPSISAELRSFFLSPAATNEMFTIFHTEYLFSKSFIESTKSFLCTLKNARERINMENRLRKELKKKGHYAKYFFRDIIHESSLMQSAISKSQKLAQSDYDILILGESGTGKELFASAIHNSSPRCKGPFIAINCSALPEELIESELFGYDEGAFTGAKKGGKIGLFEMANGGTIFLDEIGDIPPKIQLRLLRVLQEKEILKVGGNTIIHVDVRVIAATNEDLLDLVNRSVFRKDLYYRLKKLYLNLPPLRERREDILVLFAHFLHKKGGTNHSLSPETEKILLDYKWEGNIRELENTVEYILAICDEEIIMPYHLPEDLCRKQGNEFSLDPIDHFLLETINRFNKSQDSVGRKKLSELSHIQGFNQSERQSRTRIDKLAAKGYIRKFRGRFGLEITVKGREILSAFSAE
ncbi:sigma-54 interacting transcriptional regulator [Desulfitobacterium sp. LBE]|uniref:sigma-54 interaction domain-containing protein n=1 Tax=Desulfitobacterium sp. LBE TaxID=884086 RepID=UPI00119B8C67|nr:sigma 54-interacting transcriptional regulator [Desulfitobacterium sp. LBE]TWH58089.1 sigma-54 interacting transcriptional regulator [Desulfitobacterium sp. LBE]